MNKITISENVQQFIAERTSVAGGYYEYINVIAQKHALEAAEMVKQETKEACEKAFRAVITAALLGQSCGEPIDIEVEFRKIIDSI